MIICRNTIVSSNRTRQFVNQSLSTFRTLRSLRHRNFRLLLLGAILSNTGDFIQDIAQSWLVWQLTHSAFLLGLIGFFDTIPRLLFGAVGGAIADRVDRRRLLIVTQTLAMAQAFVYWFAVYFKFIVFWHVILLTLFLGAVNSINQTARQSLVNSIVPKDDLLNAIALHSSVFNMSRILGPSFGGVLIAFAGIAGCFFINGLSFLALIWSLVVMDLPSWEGKNGNESIWSEIKEGYEYVKSNRWVFSIISLSYVVAVAGAPYPRFLPVFASNILHVGPSGFGLMMAAPGLGATVSTLCLASLGIVRPGILLIGSCVFGFSVFLALFSFSRSFLFSVVLLALIGFCIVAFRASANTAIQTDTPHDLLGRVLSLFFMDRGLWSLGALLIGGVASMAGVARAFAACALICAAATAWMLLSVKRQAIGTAHLV